MPGKNLSKYTGKSSSPVANRVLQNNKNVQQPCSVKSATKSAYNKQPVRIGKGK